MTIRGKWAVALLVVLALSLALNLFIGGLAAGRALFGRGMPGLERGIAQFIEGVPPDARGAVRDSLLEHRPALADSVAALQDARRAVGELLRRPDLTREELDRALATVRERFAALQLQAHEAVAEAALSLPPEVRAKWRWGGGR